MSGLAGVSRRATAGSGRSRRNMYLADFDTEATDQATGSLPLTGGIFKNAAFEILKQEERLMTSGEITKLAMERKLLRCMGKTPENTMASALYTEVRKKASTTVFIKPKEGLFGLKAWLNEPWLLNWLAQEGIDVADVHDPGGGAEPVSKKIRTSYNGAASRAAAAGGGGGYFSHRTSSNGVPPLLRSSSAGLGPASLGGAAALNGPHRASTSGYALGHGPGGGGGRGLYTNPAAVAAATTGGGMPRPMYTGGRGGGGGGEYANGVAAGGAASTSDALSSLQLLVDAADEIEGSPEDAPPSNSRPPPVRRRSDGLLRQTSFQRQRPGISRETSLPSMIARVRVRDDFEDELEDGEDAAADEYGEQGEEEEPYDDEAAVAAALHHRDAVRMLQQRQHSSNKLYDHQHAAATVAVAQLQEQQEELEQQPAFRQRALQQQPQQQPMLLPPLYQHLYHYQQHPRPYPHQRHKGVGAAEEASEEDDGEPHGGCEPEGRAPEADGREPDASGARWMTAEVEDLRHYHQNSGVHRGGRGARGGGRTGGPADGAAVAGGRARGGRGRGTAFDSERRAVRSEEAEVEEDGQMDEDVDEGEAGSGEDAEEAGPAASAAPRRWALPPRPGADRRGGGGAAAGAGRLRQAAGTLTGRRHPDVGELPQHMHMHMTGTQSFPGQLPIPLMGMPVGLPPGALGQGPYPHAPLHLLQRMPPGAAAAGLPRNAVAMLGGGGGGGMVLSDQVLGQLRAAATMGYGTVPGLGLPPLPGLIPSQALLGMGLAPGLVGLDMGALLGEPAAELAAATAAAQTAAGGGGAAGARSHPLPPALAQIATVLRRSPGLSATLVAAQGRIAELSGVSPEAMATATEHGEDGKGMMGLLKAEAARDGRKARRDAKMEGDAPMRGGDPRVGSASAGKDDGALKCAGGPAAAAISQLAAAATGATPAGAEDGVVAGEPDSGPTLRAPSEGGVGVAAEDTRPVKQQHQQPALGEAPNRGPTSLSPPGGPAGAAAVALNDAMNSPDSQVAGCADRASPVTDDPSGRGGSGGSGSGGPTDRRPLAGERITLNDFAAAAAAWPCNSGGAAGAAAVPPASAVGTGAGSSPGEGKGPASGAGAWAQLALLQQQHLKLLLPVERARPGDVPDPQAINRIHQQVLEMELRMGALHPETGRAYVLLARVLEHKGTCWSLAMAERALMRAWTIVGVVSSSNNSNSSSRRTSDAGASGAGGASAVAGVAEAAAAEAGAGATPGELLCELPDSFHTFHYLLEQIRMKQSYLQAQQEQQLLALLQMVAMVGAPAAAAVAAAAAARGDVTAMGGIGGGPAAAAALGGLMMGGAPLPPGACDEGGYGAPAGGGGAM